METRMSLPDAISGPVAWKGSDMMAHPERWTYRLTEADVVEIEHAATAFIKNGTPLGLMTQDLFPLPKLGVWLENLRETLIGGIGFQLITGLPVETYSGEMRATIFCGIGSHIGKARSQNAAGHLLGHVRDVGADINDPNTRIYQTTSRQSFHTDSCDVVGLLCIREAMSGGDSMLASSVTAYNEILKRRPDLAPHLFLPVATDRRGEVPENEDPFFTIPVYNWHRNFLTCIYQRNYIESARRFETAPKLTDQQTEALDLLDDIVNEPDMHLRMRLQPGDMQFVYNHSLLHDRTGFTDWPEAEKRRHLLRLWLAVPEDRPLPAVFAQRYGSVDIGDRGGVITSETVLHAPVDD